jgi:hypothetical protein
MDRAANKASQTMRCRVMEVPPSRVISRSISRRPLVERRENETGPRKPALGLLRSRRARYEKTGYFPRLKEL